MKKIISLTFAVVSTTFLFVGATHAAEKFDGLARSALPTITDSLRDAPTTPCIVIDPGQDPEPDPANQNDPE